MTVSESPDGARTFRAPSGTVMLVLSILLAVFLLGDVVVRGGWMQLLLIAPWLLLALWVVYEVSFVSHIRIDGTGARVQNLLRRTDFGWSHVRDVDLRWQLVFHLDDGTELTSWGGPAHARPRRSHMRDDEETKVAGALRQFTAIRDRWQEGAGTAGPSIRRSWDVPALMALATILLWATGSVLFVATA